MANIKVNLLVFGKPKQLVQEGKSTLANEIIRDKGFNKQINDLMRDNIIKDARENQFETNRSITEDFLQLYYSLPEDKRLWKYGNNAMK